MADILLNRAIKIIPDDWKKVKIGDIGTTFGGLTKKSKKDFGEGKPFIPFMNIMSNAKIDMDDFDYVNIEENENQNCAIKGDLFFNTSSETPEEVGMCSVLYNDISELYLNSFCFGFRIKDQISLNPLFVSYFFRSDFGRRAIFPLAQGMTRYNLSKRYFLQLEIPKPRLEEQNKIIEILSTIDITIEKTATIIEETQQLKKGLMQKLFTEGIGHTRFKETKIGKIPEKWEVVRFHKCLNKAMYKDPSIMSEEEFTYIDVSAVSNKLYKITDSKRLLGKDAPGRARKEVKHGDTIYATVRPYLKRIAYISEEFDKEICSTGYCVLHPNVDFVEPKFVFQLMLTHRVNQYLKSLQVGTSYPAINDNDIYQMLIPFPTRNEQNKIANILSEVDAKIEKEEATKVELEQLKKGLMQVLLTGQIRVKVKA